MPIGIMALSQYQLGYEVREGDIARPLGRVGKQTMHKSYSRPSRPKTAQVCPERAPSAPAEALVLVFVGKAVVCQLPELGLAGSQRH